MIKIKKTKAKKPIETTIYPLLEGVVEPKERGRPPKLKKALVLD